MDERKAFLCYESYFRAAESLGDKACVAYMMGLMRYVFDGTEPELTGAAKSAWILTKPTIDSNTRRRNAGKKGGRPKAKPMVAENETYGFEKAKPMVSKDVKPMVMPSAKPMPSMIKDKGQRDKGQGIKDNRQGNPEPMVSEPAAPVSLLSEIEEFCLSHGGTAAQAAAFYAQYDRAGWKANGQPIENWRGLLLNFLRAGGGSGDKGGALPTALPTQGGAHGYRTPNNARSNYEKMRRLLEEDAEREAAEQAAKEAEDDE